MDRHLVWTRLEPPAPRRGLIPRSGLQALLGASLDAKLCLLDAPAGSGKTTLLAQWCATAGAGRMAWVSLTSDNDPTRLWISIAEAMRGVEPGVGAAALRALRPTGVDHERVVLPSLLNDLSGIGLPLVLVLDDYHQITDAICHQTVTYFLEHLPAHVHLLLATRVDPPLALARMRARGELAELRVADLQFTLPEAAALLNGSMGLQLTSEDVERLAERTEGWAAGLVLAGLSLRGRPDPSAFIADVHGDNRHVADAAGVGAGAVRDRGHDCPPGACAAAPRGRAPRSRRPSWRSEPAAARRPADRAACRPWHASRAARAGQVAAGLGVPPAGQTDRAPHRAGTGGPAAPAQPALDPGDRSRAPRLGQHGPEPGPGRVPEAPGREPGRGGHPGSPARPASRIDPNGPRPFIHFM